MTNAVQDEPGTLRERAEPARRRSPVRTAVLVLVLAAGLVGVGLSLAYPQVFEGSTADAGVPGFIWEPEPVGEDGTPGREPLPVDPEGPEFPGKPVEAPVPVEPGVPDGTPTDGAVPGDETRSDGTTDVEAGDGAVPGDPGPVPVEIDDAPWWSGEWELLPRD